METYRMRILWLYPGEGDDKIWHLSSYASVDRPFGETIASVCEALQWREQDWEFLRAGFGGEANWMRVDKARTPRECGYDGPLAGTAIVCVLLEANN